MRKMAKAYPDCWRGAFSLLLFVLIPPLGILYWFYREIRE